MKRQPLVSLVSIIYNSTEVTKDLLRSLRNITYPRIEIIIVDNGSVDRSSFTLKEDFPEITLIREEKNHGFSGGNNIGIRASKGEYILLINNDVEVTPGFLEPMLEVFEKDPKAGMVSPKIVYHNRGELLQYAGSNGINPWTGRGRKRGNKEVDRGQYDFVRETELVHGACMMVPRSMINKAGPLYEDYFLYYEEHDWAERAKKHGYKIYYAGTSKIYHKESVSTGKESPLKSYYMARNRIMFLRRNVSYPAFFTSLLIFILLAAPKNIIQYTARARFLNLKAYVRGILWHLGVQSSRGGL